MICNVCKQDKPESEFQKYWHSVPQKYYIRKQCNKCFYLKRIILKNPDLYYANNPNYRKCAMCQEYKELNTQNFHRNNIKYYSSYCKVCIKIRDSKRNKQNCGCGSEKVLEKPNKYTDPYQRSCTFEVLENLGYLYNEEIGVWIKEGIKEYRDGILVFPKVIKYKPKPGIKVTTKMVAQMIRLYGLNWTYKKIAKKLNISETTVFKHIKKWQEALKSEN